MVRNARETIALDVPNLLKDKKMKHSLLASIPLFALAAGLIGHARAADNAPAPERDLVKIEQEWGDAIVHHDASTLANILADEYVLTTPFGQVVTKAQMVESLRTPRDDSFKIKEVEQEDVFARFYGDTAVVYSRFTLKGVAAGKDVSTPFRHTDVFVKRDGRWRCVTRQATLIAAPIVPKNVTTAQRG